MLTQSPAETVILNTPVRVVYHKDGNDWYATALEFDIIGYGKDKRQALQMLQELLRDYFYAIGQLLSEGNEVAFFNPSGVEEWNRSDSLQVFHVSFSLRDGLPRVKTPIPYRSLGKLFKRTESLDDFGVRLLPA